MKKKILLFLTLLSCVVTLVACGSKKTDGVAAIKKKGTLVVAVSPDYAPFEFRSLINGKSQIVGADIMLAQDIADKLGVKLSISAMSFNNVLASVKSGKADIAISGISYTKERAKVYGFSDSYNDAKNNILIRTTEKNNIKTKADLAQKKVGVQKGAVQEQLAQEELKSSQIVSLVDMGEIVNELKSGHLDAAIMDSPVAIGYETKNKDITAMDLSITAKNEGPKVIAMAKDNVELQKEINEVIKTVKGAKFESYIKKASTLTEDK